MSIYWCCEDNKRYFGLENSRFNFTVSLVLHFHLDSSDDSDNYLENLTACELQNKSNCQSKKWNLITPKSTRTIAWRVTQSVFCPIGFEQYTGNILGTNWVSERTWGRMYKVCMSWLKAKYSLSNWTKLSHWGLII